MERNFIAESVPVFTRKVKKTLTGIIFKNITKDESKLDIIAKDVRGAHVCVSMAEKIAIAKK